MYLTSTRTVLALALATLTMSVAGLPEPEPKKAPVATTTPAPTPQKVCKGKMYAIGAEKDGKYALYDPSTCATQQTFPGKNICTSGTFSCSKDPIRFTKMDGEVAGELSCSPADAGDACGGNDIIACCG